MRIGRGESVLLLGPSGSGKSTLALTLNGLIPHIVGGTMEGCVEIAEADTRSTTVAELSQRVGIIFQDPESQFVTMSVEDEIAFGLENLQVPAEQMDQRIQEALNRVGIGEFRRRRVDALSGGEKQRLATAAVLAMRPEILVFDEPTANLDPVGTREVFETIARLKESGGYTLIIIEHKLDAVIHLIDRVVALDGNGTVLASGTPREVFNTNATQLLEAGIWMPQTALLAEHLRRRGIGLDPFPVTLDQAEEALRRLGSTHSGSGLHSEAVEQHPEIEESPDLALENQHSVKVRKLHFSYGRATILKSVNLSVRQGDYLAIVGANGAGKTTLALHLIDALHPPRNCVSHNGVDVTQIPALDLIRQVGYVFQNPEHQFITNSVADEVSFGLRRMELPADEIDTRVGSLLEQFGLAHVSSANPFTLSHGEKRRLSVATMLAVGQKTLILDEPTFGQDLRNSSRLMNTLDELHAAGRTVIIITHDMSLVARHARSCAVMCEGEIIFHGSTQELFSNREVLDRAALAPPPLAELAQRVVDVHPALSGAGTLQEFETILCGLPDTEESA